MTILEGERKSGKEERLCGLSGKIKGWGRGNEMPPANPFRFPLVNILLAMCGSHLQIPKSVGIPRFAEKTENNIKKYRGV